MKLLKKLLRRLMTSTPYELKRRLAPSTLEAGTLGLALFALLKPGMQVVQVGACDGEKGDPLYSWLKAGKIRALVLEPVPQSFARLQLTYADIENVTPIQAAIARKDGTATIYRVKDEGRWKGSSDAPLWASFDKGHLLKFGVRDEEIQGVEVKAMTLATLLEQNQVSVLDFLFVDTEGFDGQVVLMALDLSTPPSVICFEHVHLPLADREHVYEKLTARGYRWLHDGMNTLAISNPLFETISTGSIALND